MRFNDAHLRIARPMLNPERIRGFYLGGAGYIRLWGSATRDPRDTIDPGAAGGDWRAHHVVLGYTHDAASPRWLTSSEISTAALTALDQKQDDLIAGQTPWDQRP